MQFLARTAQQCAVGSVLHKGMLEQKSGVWGYAVLEHQSRISEPAERILQFRLAPSRDCGQQLIGEVAADGGADLRDRLGCRAEAIETSQQRGVQARRDREWRDWPV